MMLCIYLCVPCFCYLCFMFIHTVHLNVHSLSLLLLNLCVLFMLIPKCDILYCAFVCFCFCRTQSGECGQGTSSCILSLEHSKSLGFLEYQDMDSHLGKHTKKTAWISTLSLRLEDVATRPLTGEMICRHEWYNSRSLW